MAYSAIVLADAPKGYWRLEEYSGTSAADSSGNGHDGTLSGNYAQYASSILPGFPLASRCVEFNEGRVTVANHADFSGATEVTLEAWFEVSTTGSSTRHTVLMRGTDDASGLGVIVDDACFTSSGSIRVYAGNVGSYTYTASLDVDTPYHIVVTIDATATNLYLNNSLVATWAGGTLSLGSVSITIGQQDRVAYEYSLLGFIDEVAFYDTALSAADVETHYEAGLEETSSTGDLDLPALTAAGSAAQAMPLSGTPELPALTAVGTGYNTPVFEGTLELPGLTAVGYFGAGGALELPALTASGVALRGTVLSGSVALPSLQAAGADSDDRTVTGAVTLKGLRSSGQIVNGAYASGEPSLRPLRVSGQAYAGTVATGVPTLGALESRGTWLAGGMATGALRLPALVSEGLTGAQLTTFAAWVVGAKSFAHTTYSNYPFLALGKVGSQYLGVASDGVYLLSGDADQSTEINVDVRTGYEAFDSDVLKRVLNVYAAMESDGEVEVQLNMDGEDKLRTYPLLHKGHLEGKTRARADGARGLRSRYWQVGLRTRNGARFEVSEMNVLVQKLNRKV
jgi:hypothetical protein